MNPVLDTTQLVSGVAILLSFLAGYRYALRDDEKGEKKDKGAAADRVSVQFHFKSINLRA